MENFKQKAYNVFELFDRQWALVTAGSIEHYNSCTVGWGSLGNLWGPTGRSRPTVTVYVHPARYTCEFLEQGDTFTVTYAEANLTFLCKKLYQHQFTAEDLAPEVQAYYASMPQVYPDFHGGWQPHLAFVGEIIDVIDKR